MLSSPNKKKTKTKIKTKTKNDYLLPFIYKISLFIQTEIT
jgi:hypothetical protein